MNPISYIPLDKPFMPVFAGLLKKINDFSDTCVVFPGRRPFLYLQREIIKGKPRGCISPDCLTMDELMFRILEDSGAPTARITRLDALWVLYKIVQNIQGSRFSFSSFDKFLPWGTQLYRFINQLDSECVDQDKLRQVEENASMGMEIPVSVLSLLENISTIHEQFNGNLKERGQVSRGFAYRQAADFLKKENRLVWKKIFFGGQFGLTGAERSVIKCLLKDGSGSMVWHGDPQEWKILRDLEKDLGYKAVCAQKSTGKKPVYRIHAADDLHGQILAVRGVLAQSPVKDTVVVLPAQEALFPLLNFTVDPLVHQNKLNKFNISMGYRMERTSFFGLLSALVEAQLRARRIGAGLEYHVSAYQAVLSSPFVKNLFLNEENRLLRTGLKEVTDLFGRKGLFFRRAFIPLEALEKGLKPETRALMKKLHDQMFRSLEAKRSLKEISEALTGLVDFFLKQSLFRSYVLASEVIGRTLEILQEMQVSEMAQLDLLPYLTDQDPRLLFTLFVDHFSGEEIHFNTEPVQDLEIIGMLETRILNFSRVCVLNLQEGVLPGPRFTDPLVPVSLYPLLGLPSLEFNEEMYRYYFFRLVRGAQKVDLFYVDQEDSYRSRYIEEVIWEEEEKAGKTGVMNIEHSGLSLVQKHHPPPEGRKKTDSMLSLLLSRAFSPTAVSLYLRCPLRFYYEKVLGLTGRQSVSTDLEAEEVGNIVHDLLRKVFQPLIGKKLQKVLVPDLKLKAENELGRALKEKKLRSGEYVLLEKILLRMLNSFFPWHISESDGRTVVCLEQPVSGLSVSVQGQTVLFKGVIDRVDSDPVTGGYRIYDYKTGKNRKLYGTFNLSKIGDLDDVLTVRKELKDFQLYLYSLFLKRINKNAVFEQASLVYVLSTEETSLISKDQNAEKVLEAYRHGLKTVLEHIFDPKIPFSRFEDSKCGACPHAQTCSQYTA